jgi:hypothetical protein
MNFWVSFKVFGIMPLTIAFALAQTPLLLRYERKKVLGQGLVGHGLLRRVGRCGAHDGMNRRSPAPVPAAAAVNEVVCRTQTTDFWVSFKVFGIMPLTIAFALAQVTAFSGGSAGAGLMTG